MESGKEVINIKFTKMRIVTVLLAFIMSGLINAQSVKDKVCLDNTEQFSIASKYVAGENYVIQVGLPIGYSPEKNLIPCYMYLMEINHLE